MNLLAHKFPSKIKGNYDTAFRHNPWVMTLTIISVCQRINYTKPQIVGRFLRDLCHVTLITICRDTLKHGSNVLEIVEYVVQVWLCLEK